MEQRPQRSGIGASLAAVRPPSVFGLIVQPCISVGPSIRTSLSLWAPQPQSTSQSISCPVIYLPPIRTFCSVRALSELISAVFNGNFFNFKSFDVTTSSASAAQLYNSSYNLNDAMAASSVLILLWLIAGAIYNANLSWLGLISNASENSRTNSSKIANLSLNSLLRWWEAWSFYRDSQELTIVHSMDDWIKRLRKFVYRRKYSSSSAVSRHNVERIVPVRELNTLAYEN